MHGSVGSLSARFPSHKSVWPFLYGEMIMTPIHYQETLLPFSICLRHGAGGDAYIGRAADAGGVLPPIKVKGYGEVFAKMLEHTKLSLQDIAQGCTR